MWETGKTAHAFVDGAYLREVADRASAFWLDPRPVLHSGRAHLQRVTYYDARPDSDEDVSPDLQEYWDAVERLPSTHLGFGALRGKRPRQKGVDTLMAVDMLVGAFDHIFHIAILVSGDADFVPVVLELRRRGVTTQLVADPETAADDLVRAVDIFIPMPEAVHLKNMALGKRGECWPRDRRP